MNSQKHSGCHILLAYHNCIFSDLIVIHTRILHNLKNKTKLDIKKRNKQKKPPAFMEWINCFKYQSIFSFNLFKPIPRIIN